MGIARFPFLRERNGALLNLMGLCWDCWQSALGMMGGLEPEPLHCLPAEMFQRGVSQGLVQEGFPDGEFWIKAQDVCIQIPTKARNLLISPLLLHGHGMRMLPLEQRGFQVSKQKFPAETLLNPTWHSQQLPWDRLGTSAERIQKGKSPWSPFFLFEGLLADPSAEAAGSLAAGIKWMEFNPSPVSGWANTTQAWNRDSNRLS